MPTVQIKIAVYPPPSADLPYIVAAIFPGGSVTAIQAPNGDEAAQIAYRLASEFHAGVAEMKKNA